MAIEHTLSYVEAGKQGLSSLSKKSQPHIPGAFQWPKLVFLNRTHVEADFATDIAPGMQLVYSQSSGSGVLAAGGIEKSIQGCGPLSGHARDPDY